MDPFLKVFTVLVIGANAFVWWRRWSRKRTGAKEAPFTRLDL